MNAVNWSMCSLKPTRSSGSSLIPVLPPLLESLPRTWIFVILLLSSCKENVRSNEEVVHATDSSTKKNGIYLDLKTILEKEHRRNAIPIRVNYDPNFGSPKKYMGYPIKEIIDSMVKLEHFDTTKAIIAFECVDGYRPMMDLSKTFGEVNGYIVYKDLSQPTNKDWADSIESKFKPYYLVWDNVSKNDDSFMWPYGLIGVRLISRQTGYESVYPSKNVSLVNGFYLFRDHCMKCHSVNRMGGTLGPEMNVPKNITEYWQENDIILFAKNPNAYRYNSRMPAETDLKDADFKEIISYLKYMKDNKVQK